MKTTADILNIIESTCQFMAAVHFCSTLPVDCIYCGIDEYLCPRYIYRICAEAIERGEYR